MATLMDARAGDVDRSAYLRARDLTDVLERHAIETEQNRRVHEDCIAAMRGAGLFRLLQPRRFGGEAACMGEFTRAVAELAKGCASSAWVASVANHAAWVAAKFPDDVLEEVWGGDPNAIVCGVFQSMGGAELAEDGVVLSGKWPFGSGSLHAKWALLGYQEPGVAGPAGARLALVPIEQLDIEDSWFVSGLKGTGSNTLAAGDVFVPAARTIALAPLMEGPSHHRPGEHTFDVPMPMMLCTLAVGPMLGLGRAMLERVISTVSTRSIYTTIYDDASEAPTIHLQIGEAASRIEAAEMFASRLSADGDRFSKSASAPAPVDRARVRMDTAAVALHVAKAMELLINVSGASSFAEGNPVQRMHRDFEVMRRHASVATELSKEHYGRVLLGKPGVILIA